MCLPPTAQPSGKMPRDKKKQRTSSYDYLVGTKLRRLFSNSDFSTGILASVLKPSIWLDGEVTDVDTADSVPVFICAFGNKFYRKVIRVQGMKTIQKLNDCFVTSKTPAPVPAPAPAPAPILTPAPAPVPTRMVDFPSIEGI